MSRNQRRKLERKQRKVGYQIKVTNPIQGLEKYGYKILTDSNGKIKVGVDKSYNLFEGSLCWKRDETFDESKIQLIDKNDIKNYNSLWELTKSGWDSVGDEMVNPYINLNGDWIRWDNQTMRREGGFYEWDNHNQSKYMNYLLTNNIMSKT